MDIQEDEYKIKHSSIILCFWFIASHACWQKLASLSTTKKEYISCPISDLHSRPRPISFMNMGSCNRDYQKDFRILFFKSSLATFDQQFSINQVGRMSPIFFLIYDSWPWAVAMRTTRKIVSVHAGQQTPLCTPAFLSLNPKNVMSLSIAASKISAGRLGLAQVGPPGGRPLTESLCLPRAAIERWQNYGMFSTPQTYRTVQFGRGLASLD